MFVQRLTKAIKTQNWFAVVLEVGVVVLGVFLGFQVTEWNEERQLTAQRGIYLERLRDNIERDIAEAEIVIGENQRAMADIRRLESIAENPELAASDPEAFLTSFSSPSFMRWIYLVRSTFDELRSNGLLSVLDNRELEDRLIGYYSMREVRDQWVDEATVSSMRFAQLSAGLLSLDQTLATWPFRNGVDIEFPDLEIDTQEAVAIARRMADRTELVEALPRLYLDKMSATREAVLTRSESEALLTLIDRELEVER